MMKNKLRIASLVLIVTALGCEKVEEKPIPKPIEPSAAKPMPDKKDTNSHGSAFGEKPVPAPKSAGHGGEVIDLGETKIGAFSIRASRDKVEFKAGGDAAVDVWINGGVGEGVTAVRFWIGTEDAKGSLKAKADIEDGKWHNHVEIPSPIPTDCKLWIEIEESAGKKIIGSFDLKN